MTPEDALMIFKRLGANVQYLSSRLEFDLAYYRLARRYHPDLNPRGHEVMATLTPPELRSLRPVCSSVVLAIDLVGARRLNAAATVVTRKS